MRCRFCENNYKCSIHEVQPGIKSNTLSTGLAYTKEFKIYDTNTGEIKTKKFRSRKERAASPFVEVDTKIATCTKCGYFREAKNFHIPSRKGSTNVIVCNFCELTTFANNEEMRNYIVKHLRQKYHGEDPRIVQLLQETSH